MLNFSDGVSINTEGPLRKRLLPDGWYVVGMGMCIPANDAADADEIIESLNATHKENSDAKTKNN